LREIATIYGYRPGVLALRALALSAVRDAGAVAVASALGEAVADTVGRTATELGDSMMTGATTSAAVAGIGPILGVAATVVGAGVSVAGRLVSSAGGPLSGGVTAAWRISRFGLMALIAARPIPLDDHERAELLREIRASALRLTRQSS